MNNLETSRLSLTKTVKKDLKELANIMSLDEVKKYMIAEEYTESDYSWTIEVKEYKEIIGQVSLIKIDKELELDIFLDPLYQNKGYGYEACMEVLKYMFCDIEEMIICAFINVFNNRGIHLLEKIGFKKINKVLGKDIYKYQVTKKEFLKELFRKDELYISEDIDKEPYSKHLSDDYILNVTGESGSGKSTLCLDYINDNNYIVIDTDELYSDKTNDYYCLELRKYFINKYQEMPNLIDEFDLVYEEIINYFKDCGKWLVIDSAQYRNIKDYSILKGDIIILRTCINTCYRRCLERFNSNHSSIEMIDYMKRKKGIYKWYHALNRFIDKIDRL